MPVTTGRQKVRTNTMKAYHRPRQYIYHNSQCDVSPGLSLLVSVCVLMLPMLGLVDEHVQLTTIYHMNPINQWNVHSHHMTFRQTPLVLMLPSLDNVLPAMALQNRVVWSNTGFPSYTSSQSDVCHILPILHLNLPSGLGRRVVGVVLTLLLLLSGDIETNSGPVGQQLSKKDLLNVMEELADVRAKWYNIGLGLGVSVGTLNCIETEYSNNSDSLRATLMKWLNAYFPHPTWSKVVEALRTKTVDEARLAAHLERKYCSSKPVSSLPAHWTTTTRPLVTTPSPQYSVLPPSSTLDCPTPSPEMQAPAIQPPTVTTPPHHTVQEEHTVPSVPTIVSVEATSSTSITVQWNASKNDRGSPITGYIVEYRPTSSPVSLFETLFVEQDVSSTTLDGLTPSTEYEVRVRGENAVGHSVPSTPKRTKTKSDSELQRALRPYTVKAKPTGIVLGSGTYGRVIELKSAGEIVAGKVFKTSSYIHQKTLTNKLFGELSLMTQVHHPNIVQCKGVCFLENETMPVLLMERLMSSLHAYVLDPTNSNIALARKLSILCDVASGLVYLHSHKPAIVHRDLTGNNILLDSKLRAKISDFGNARLMDLDPEATPGIFTALPGTPDYMPPEAQGDSAKCGPSLDVFSFGHLSLFTINQSLVHPLLPSTYIDVEELLHARSEVKRREQYLERTEQLLGEKHSLVMLIKQCLHNSPAQRPQTAELVTKLQAMHPQPVQQNPLVGASQQHTSQQVREPSRKQQLGRLSQGETAMKPTLSQLKIMKSKTGEKIKIIESVAPQWKELGDLLDFDPEGQTLELIEANHQMRGYVACCREMSATWLKGKGKEATWEVLIELLDDIDQSELAKQVKTALYF